MTKNLKQEIQVYKNLIKKGLYKEADCQMDRVIETIKEEIMEKKNKVYPDNKRSWGINPNKRR